MSFEPKVGIKEGTCCRTARFKYVNEVEVGRGRVRHMPSQILADRIISNCRRLWGIPTQYHLPVAGDAFLFRGIIN